MSLPENPALNPGHSIRLTVNNHVFEGLVDPDKNLLRFLREDLGLVGAKNGCEKGACGACTVIVDGKAKRACLLKVGKLSGSTILTIEGLLPPPGLDGKQGLHPIQQAFVEEGAVQCGFCTPGMVMATKALLDAHPDPSDAEIGEALKDNLCRCTGYQAIRRAVRRAARNLSETGNKPGLPRESPRGRGIVGTPLPRRDAPERARGQALFSEDLADLYDLRERKADIGPALDEAERRFGGIPGKGPSLWGLLVFSPKAHTRILEIDTSKAEAAPGVIRILLAKDVPGRNAFGLFVPQQPVICDRETRYLGDVLAVILAESREEALAARNLMELKLEELPFQGSTEENLAPESPLVHAGSLSNIVSETHVKKGDIDLAFSQAAIIVEDDFDTPAIEHGYLEPEACLAIPEADGGVTLYTGNQGSGEYQEMIAASLGLSLEKVRVILVACGGAFGGKEEPTVQIHAALGAMLTGRAVRMTLSREESIRMSTKRHPTRIKMAHAASRDGRLLGLTSRVIADAGAYISQTMPVVFRSAVTASGPYDVEAIAADSYGVYTHRNPSGALRGFGSTQPCFACEIQMDELARALGMDPVELRRKTGYRPGARTGTGQLLSLGADYLGTLNKAAEALEKMKADFRKPVTEGWKLGFGIASSYKNVGIGAGFEDGSSAIASLEEDGSLRILTGAADMGQGSDTVAAQIAAEEFGLPIDLVEVLACDTRECPDGGMTTASRQTYVTGNAVRLAVRKLKQVAAPFSDSDDTPASDRKALRTLRSRILAAGLLPKTEVRYAPPKTRAHQTASSSEGGLEDGIHYAYCFATAAVAVEADEASGRVRVLRLCLAQDAGKAINPLAVRGQIEGAAVFGLGYALSERFACGQDGIETGNLRSIGLPRYAEVPEIEAIIVESPEPEGPFGAKGMGEVGVNPIAPAISNAIFDALGVRLRSLPMTKEKVLAACLARGGSDSPNAIG